MLKAIDRSKEDRFLPLSAAENKPEHFQIRFLTNRYAPNHKVTLRNNWDGWSRNIYGVFRDGEWVFTLDSLKYPPKFEGKFVLNDALYMQGDNISFAASEYRLFTENEVSFSDAQDVYYHGYDNLRVDEDEAQQALLRSNYDEERVYDVVIVGSGTGGGILADALTDQGIAVLVLEIGCLEFETHICNLPGEWDKLPGRHEVGHFRNESGSKLALGAQMNLGGRSVFWSGIIPRMRNWELAFWPETIRRHLRDSGYTEAERLMRRQSTLGEFQDSLKAQLAPHFPEWDVSSTPRAYHQPDIGAQSYIQHSTGLFSTAELLVDSLSTKGHVGRDCLTINLNHLVTRLNRDGSTITSIVCQDLVGNRERTYKGRVFVLSAGSLETPKIALASKLPNPNGLVGVGLTDHPSYMTPSLELPPDSPFAGLDKHAKISLYPRDPSAYPNFNVEIVLNGDFWDVRHADDDVWAAILSRKRATTLEIKCICGSKLDNDNFVRLGERDQKLRVSVKHNDAALLLAGAAKAMRNRLLKFFGVTNVNPEEDMFYGADGTVNHAGGTMRMSDDGRGVVDDNLKFEGIDNLYISDVSVFPFIPAANPSLTMAALSLRLAKYLAARLP